MVTAIKHSVLERVKASFVIFDVRALWRSYGNNGRWQKAKIAISFNPRLQHWGFARPSGKPWGLWGCNAPPSDRPPSARVLTIVVVAVEVNVVWWVSELDEFIAVRPALNDDTARLPVKREQSAVHVTRSVHYTIEPPRDPPAAVQPQMKPVEVLRIERCNATT